MILGLVFALVVAAFQQGGSAEPRAAIQHGHAMRTNNTSKLPLALTNLLGEFTRKLTPLPWCLKSRASLQKKCLRLGLAAAFVSELPMLNTRGLATRQNLSSSSALSMSGTNT